MDKDRLSQREAEYREAVLNGPITPLIIKTCLPLVVYQTITLIFAIFDTAISAHLGEACVSAVAFISQITLLIGSISNGLAVGGSVIIASHYGAGNYEKMRQSISTFYFLCFLCSVPVLMIYPFSARLLFALGASETMIKTGMNYFRIDLLSKIVTFFNAVYLVIERTKGNTRRIMSLNIASLTIKLTLSLVFVYLLNYGLDSLAWASLLSKIFILVFGFIASRDNPLFSFRLENVNLKRDMLIPVFKTALPAMFEHVSLYAGKIIVNSMGIIYGDFAIGALGVSNNLGGIGVAPQLGLQEGGVSLLSQNYGAGNLPRCRKVFMRLLMVILVTTAFCFAFVLVFFHPLISLFSSGNDEFYRMIAETFRYEMLGFFPLGISSAVCALLYASRHTRATLIISFCRVFVLRVPVLYYLQHYTRFGSRSLGIVMLVSNGGTGLIAVVVALFVFFVIPHFRRKKAAEKV